LATGNSLIFPKFPKSLERSKKKNLPSSSLKSIASGRGSGKREELENYVFLSTRLQATSEFW
jgi:hypothetical protein